MGAIEVTIIAPAARTITTVTITPMSYILFTAQIVLLLVSARALADALLVFENSVCIRELEGGVVCRGKVWILSKNL